MRGRWTANRRAFLAAGACLWLAAVASVVVWASTRRGSATPVDRVLDFVAAEPRTVAAELPRGRLEPGDRVLHFADGRLRACGEVVGLERPVGGATVTLALYPDAGLPDPLPAGTRLVLFDARGTLEWALARVLSAERRARLGTELKAMATQREGWLREVFGPVLEEFARGVVTDITAELSGFVRTHEEQLREVGRDVLDRARTRWEPLLRELLWPRVVVRLTPLAERLGNELWNELPWSEIASSAAESGLSSLANVFLPANYELSTDQILRWRDRYLANRAIPKVASYLPEALEAVGEVVTEAMQDDRVRQAMQDTLLRDGLGNPKVMGLLAEAFSAAVPANPRLRERLQALFDDPRIRRALYDLAEQLEPHVLTLARMLLLDEEDGALHPELAMLARVRLIGSEGRWVLLELPDDDDGAAGAGAPRPEPRDPGATAARSAGPVRLRIEEYSGSRTEVWERPLR
ncbi:MAG: hypothetical protein JXB32_19205 [Deltaproteobacteria bacterium]|nr:hypothetical protein [Deltaproteobacteria bacterium]